MNDKEKLDLPDGWTCISCGEEYLEDTTGKDVANYDEGTLCLSCQEVATIEEIMKKNIKEAEEENKR